MDLYEKYKMKKNKKKMKNNVKKQMQKMNMRKMQN